MRRDGPGQHPARSSRAPDLLILACGIVAAVHVGKLPPALPVLREALGIGLVQAGFLVSGVQGAAMTLALALGLWADRIGLSRAGPTAPRRPSSTQPGSLHCRPSIRPCLR